MSDKSGQEPGESNVIGEEGRCWRSKSIEEYGVINKIKCHRTFKEKQLVDLTVRKSLVTFEKANSVK